MWQYLQSLAAEKAFVRSHLVNFAMGNMTDLQTQSMLKLLKPSVIHVIVGNWAKLQNWLQWLQN